MTLRHLSVFATVVENGGITKAAESLHIAQPAVSQTISDIEKYYNIILFDRINNKIILTEDGKELYLKAKEVLNSFDDFESVALSKLKNPSLNLGVSISIGKSILPTMTKLIEKNYPDIKLSLLIAKTSIIENKILSGELDFGIVEGKIKDKNIDLIPFKKDNLVIVANKDYNIHTEITLKDLSKEKLCIREYGCSSRDYLDSVMSMNELSYKPFLESMSHDAILSFLENNLGVAILPKTIVKKNLNNGILKEIKIKDINFERTSSIIIHKNKKLNRLQREVFNHLCSNIWNKRTNKADALC